MSRGTLFVVATPIGNLGDLTPRAAETLRAAAAVAAEDRGRTRPLLAHVGSEARLLSYREENREKAAEQVLAYLAEGKAVALVTDAGTPGVSDPGHYLVGRAVEAGFPVVPIPGPAALTAALSAAGLDLPRFLFEGFLPAKAGARRTRLRELAATGLPFVLYEAPHRIRETLLDLAAEAGGRRTVLAREVTKLHEEFLRGTAEELAERMGKVEPRGEMTVVVEGGEPAEPGTRLAVELEKAIALVRESGVGASRGAALLAALTGMDRKEIYRKLSEEE